jgi:excisionase family DNA binding protein
MRRDAGHTASRLALDEGAMTARLAKCGVRNISREDALRALAKATRAFAEALESELDVGSAITVDAAASGAVGALVLEPRPTSAPVFEDASAPRAALEPPPLLTVEEAADLLRTSRKAVYALIERAQLAGVTRLGRRVLIRRAELLQFLAEERVASPGRTRR